MHHRADHQFTISGLLILTTVTAVGFGVVAAAGPEVAALLLLAIFALALLYRVGGAKLAIVVGIVTFSVFAGIALLGYCFPVDWGCPSYGGLP